MFGRLFRLIFFQLILCYHGLQRKVLRSVPKSNQIFILRNSDTKFNANNDDDTNFNEPGIIIDGTREAIVEVIEQSWLRVCQFMPPESLSLCENELREMMSLLVLASVRRSAITSNLDTRNSVQTMFQQADQNKDGKVSFLEWFEWLSSSDTYSSNQRIESHYSTDTANSVRIPKNQVITSDPMVDTLDRVLSHAVYTVKVASRIDRDPTFLCSAFVAGGVSSGGLDQEVCTAMLSRLSPTARELVTATLSLELGSMTPVIGTFDSPLMSELTNVSSTENSMSSFVRQISDIAQSTGISKPNRLLSSQRKSLDLYFMPQLKADTSQNDLDVSQNAIVDVSIEENDRLTSTTNSFAKTTSLLFRKRDTDNNDSDNYRSGAFIQTIDLASIPVLTAPSINDEVLKSNGPPVQADILLQDNSLQNREERNSIESSAYRQSTSYAYSAEESLSDEVFSEIAKKDSYRIALHTTSNSQSYNTRNSQNNDITSRDSRSDIKTILPRFDELSDSTPDKTEVEVYLRSPPNPITDFDTKNLNIIHSDSDSDSGANSDFTYTSKVVSANTVILHNQESDNNIESIDDDMKILSDSNALTQLITTESNEYKSAEELYKRASKTLLDIQRMRSSLTDFDDRNAGMLRQVILGRTGGRAEVLKLALSLRAARLQHAAALPNVVRQRIAVETLQVWAPLSFQVGLSAQVPELEVHSYVLLFPQSFNSFLGWFDCFRPLARKLLRKFRDSLQGKLQTDPVLPSFATKVTIQSRIKTPSSAFKKMVKSSKRQQQLHDILGLRIIVSESMLPWNRPSITTSDALDFDSNSILVEEVDNVDPLVPLDSTVVNKDQAVDLDDYQYDDFSDEYEDEDDIHKEFAVWRVHDVITESLADSSSTESVDSGKSSTSSSSSGDALTVESLSDEPLDDVDTDAAMYVDCMNEWAEDLSRFKDYVTEPKPSGYQSLHMTLMHRQTGIRLEVQIRSQRMHLVAEYGTAAHRNYKALALPATSSAKWRTE